MRQKEFDWLVPTSKELLRSDEVAAILNQSEDFVYKLRQEGRLECHSHPGRTVQRFRVTRRSLIAYLAESAEYKDHKPYVERILACLPYLDAEGLHRVLTDAAKLSRTINK
jgi:hypothetical protein